MAVNNFKIFDENSLNILSDSEYATDAQRLSGVSSGVARSILINKALRQATIMSAAIAQLMYSNGLNATENISTLIASLYRVATLPTWSLIQSYTAAGTYTFVAPDLYGDGSAYQIGVVIEGGAGSGGACVYKSNNTNWAAATGGGSGVRVVAYFTVTPNVAYNVVVGSGGVSVSAQADGGSVSGANANGNAGGSSSFAGTVASGGQGGLASSATTGVSGVTGGIGSDNADQYGSSSLMIAAPCRRYPLASGNVVMERNVNALTDYINPFNPAEVSLAAGGGVWSYYGSQVRYQPTAYIGLTTGAASIAYGGAITGMSGNMTYTANPSTSPACGGSAAAATCYNTGNNTTYILKAVSAKGADGRVAIYARKAV